MPVSFEIPDRLSGEDRERAERLLGELAELRRQNPLAFYEPHAKQALYHGAHTRIKAFLGGLQSGKTTGGLADDLIQAVDRDVLPEHLLPFKRFEPPFLCRIVAPDFTSTMEGVVFEKLRELAPKDQLLGGRWDKAYDKQLRRLHFGNGSRFDFLTYEQDLDKFGGSTLDRVHFDEEPPGEKGRQIYLQARARVMARGGDIAFTMTPEFGMSWMFDEVYERRHDAEVSVVQVTTDDNTSLSREAIEETFASYSEEELEFKRKGRFVAFGGLVVDLDPERHFVDRVSPQHVQGLTTFRIIDPGAAQGAVLWAGFDKDDVMLVFDELYPRGRENEVPNLAAQIREKDAFWGIRPFELIDPSARNRTTDGGSGVEQAYFDEGLFPQRAKNDRFHSVMQLRRRISADPAGIVVVRENCPNFIWEAGRWRVAEDERDHDRVKRGATGDTFATTGPDHLMDCARYAAMEWVWGPEKPNRIDDYVLRRDEAPPGAFLNRRDAPAMV